MTHRLSLLRCFLIVLAAVAAGTMAAAAQARFSIRGTVTDATGAAVPGAEIRLQTVAGTSVAETRSSTTGEFSLDNVAAGPYVLALPASNGFAAKSMTLRVSASIPALKIKLALDAVTQTVNVGEEDTLSTQAAANKDAVVISGASLEKVPVFDQDFIGALTPFLDPGAGSSGGITILVDGVEMKASTVSPSAIAEVRVNSDPYSAEFSRPGRGRLDIITKPGSPEFHGELNFIARDAVFNASNYFAQGKPAEQRRIYEGHLSGPVGRGGHTTFLLSGNRREEDTAAAVHAFDPQATVANVPTPRRDNQLSMRVTHDFSTAHRVSLGYNFEYGTRQNSGVGGLVLPEAGVNTDSREDDLIFSDRIIINPRLLNQFQVTLEKDEDVTRSVTNKAAIQVQDAFTGGGAQADLNRTENTIHINDVVSWTPGKHYMRFGANVPQISYRAVDDRTNRLGTFNYYTVADFNNAKPYLFTQQQGPGRGIYWINEISGFFQDDVKVRKNFEVTVGVRYQWQTYISDKKDFAPRLSAAYSPSKKTILRAGAGIFYDRTGGDFPATFKLHNGIVLQTLQVVPGQSLTAVPTSIVRMDAHARAPYSIQYSFGVERQVTPVLALTAGYRGVLGVSSFRSRDANAPVLPPNANPAINYPRPDPAFGRIQQIESGGRLLSNALDVSLRSSGNAWFNGQAQYTLGRTYTNTDGINFYPQDQYNPNAEWSRAGFDRLQRFNLLGNIHPDHWLTLGVSATLYSGAPYTELQAQDLFHTALGNARPSGVARNTLQGGGTADLDLLWDHDFKLEKKKGDHVKTLNTGVSVFNALNHPNFTNYVGTTGSANFGRPTAALAGRQVQFGLRYEF